MKKAILALVTIVSLGGVSHAQASHQQVSLRNPCWGACEVGQGPEMNFGSAVYIDRLSVMVEGRATTNTVDVYVDGVWTAEFPVPRVDPPVTFPIRTTATQIKLVVRAGRVSFSSAYAFTSPFHYEQAPRLQYTKATSTATSGLAERAKQVVSNLHDNLLDGVFRSAMIPIRKAAIRLKSISQATGGESDPEVAARADILVNTIRAASVVLDQMSYAESYVDDVQELELIAETLKFKYKL